MADNKDKKALNVPALRFPEFSGEWERCALAEICNIVGRIGFRGYTIQDIVDKGTGAIALSPSNITDNRLSYDKDNTYISYFKYEESPEIKVFVGDIVFVKTGSTVGKVAYVDNILCETTLNPQLVVLKKIKCNSFLLGQILSASKFQNAIKRITVGGAVPTLSQNEMGKISVSIPQKMEQKKIATLFHLIDERISVQNKIIEDLKKLKSAIVEALFCAPKESMPAKRLSSYSKEWKLVKLFDICQRIQTKNAGRQCRQVLTIAAQYGLVNQEDFFNKTVASENLEGYYLLQKGDFAYNKSYSGDYAWGAIKRLERYEQGVLSPLYICFRPNIKVDADYLAHYFESKKWYKGIADIAGEGARNHGLLNISVIDFFNTIHRIPDLEEQKVIAQFLNKFSSKLSCEQRIMQSLTKQRNYLLQKMFM